MPSCTDTSRPSDASAPASRGSRDWNFAGLYFPVIGHRTAGVLLVLGSLALAGCATQGTMDRLDAKVAREVERRAEGDPGISEETVADAAQQIEDARLPSTVSITLNSTSVLTVATSYSRELQNQRDSLYRSGLSLFSTRRSFGTEIAGTIEYVVSGADDEDDTSTGSAGVSASRILPTGGQLEVSGRQQIRSQTSATGSDEDEYSSRAEVRLDQPLLAGAGYAASHEELTQAERDYLYALRDFALQRQQFAIRTLGEYYSLLTRRKVVENTETNYQQFIFLRQRSEALFKVNRAPAIDVLRSQQEELTALNNLTTTKTSFQIQTARFLVSLGLPQNVGAVLEDDVPGRRPVELDEEEAVRLALERRLDVMTQRDRVEDARRRVKVERNLYLPEVNAFGSAGAEASDAASFSDQEYANDWQAGIRAEIPFDRRDRRDAVKNAQLDLDSAERSLAELQDVVTLEVRDGYSRLRSLTVSLDIQLQNIEIATRRAKNALFQFRNGSLSNRDVVEAANDLLDARNAYVEALTDYEIQRLTLLRQIGLLDVARDGRLIELDPGA